MWWNLIFNTRISYKTILNNYKIFCAFELCDVIVFFVSIFIFTAWAISLNKKHIASKTIKTYICEFRSTYIDRSYENFIAFESPILQRYIRGIKRKNGEINKRKRKAITRDILLKILANFDIFIRREITLHAAFCFAFANFLRIDEFIYKQDEQYTFDFNRWHVIKSSIIFYENSLNFTLSTSKNDFFRKNITLHIIVSNDDDYSITSLRYLFEQYFVFVNSFLFEIEFNKIFNTKLVTNVLRHQILFIGEKDNYSNHFFRRKTAIEIRKAKVPKIFIQLLDRWTFNIYLLYIEINKNSIFNVFRQHQRFLKTR